MFRRLLGTFALVAVAGGVLAAPAHAARDGSSHGDRRISVSGAVVVTEDEVVDGSVVSFDGSVTVDGTVDGNVFVADGGVVIRGRVTGGILVAHGDVLITGNVGDDVIALDGRITTRDGARVDGDVKSRREPDVAPGTVTGDVKKLNVQNLYSGILFVFLVYLWIAVTLSVALSVFPLLIARGRLKRRDEK